MVPVYPGQTTVIEVGNACTCAPACGGSAACGFEGTAAICATVGVACNDGEPCAVDACVDDQSCTPRFLPPPRSTSKPAFSGRATTGCVEVE